MKKLAKNWQQIYIALLLIAVIVCILFSRWQAANYFLIMYAIEIFQIESKKIKSSLDLIWYFIAKRQGEIKEEAK